METEKRCCQCGLKFEVNSGGVTNHLDDYGDKDWDADADHPAYEID